ncbi:unnamed protein product, partial [Allacma fusca]
IPPNTTRSFGFEGDSDWVAGFFSYCIRDRIKAQKETDDLTEDLNLTSLVRLKCSLE